MLISVPWYLRPLTNPTQPTPSALKDKTPCVKAGFFVGCGKYTEGDIHMPKRGQPSPHKGKPRPELRGPRPASMGPRPHVWRSGPDPAEHKKYRAFIQHRNQSQFRGEPWDITWEQYKEIWAERWHQRGRTKDTYCLTRRDYDLPWTWTNIEVITRAEHNRRQLQHKTRL